VRIIYPNRLDEMGEWSELSGPYLSLAQAEAFVENPPELMMRSTTGGTVPHTVTIVDREQGYYVLSLETPRIAA
jgi:hypothetical protein